EIPIRRRVIESYLQSILPAGGDELAHEVATAHVVLRIEIAIGARPERESLVMARGQHGVGKPGVLRRLQPALRMVVLRIEVLGEVEVGARSDLRRPTVEAVDHRPGYIQALNGADAPVDEEAESGLRVPLRVGIVRVPLNAL